MVVETVAVVVVVIVDVVVVVVVVVVVIDVVVAVAAAAASAPVVVVTAMVKFCTLVVAIVLNGPVDEPDLVVEALESRSELETATIVTIKIATPKVVNIPAMRRVVLPMITGENTLLELELNAIASVVSNSKSLLSYAFDGNTRKPQREIILNNCRERYENKYR